MKRLWIFRAALAAAVIWTGCGGMPVEKQQTSAAAEPPADSKAAPAATVAPPPPPPPPPVVIPAGQALRIRTSTALSTKSAQAGEAFEASLAAPLVAGGKTVAGKGAAVSGVVVDSDPGGRVKGRASLSIRLTSIRLASGKTLEVSTSSFQVLAKPSKKKDALKIGIGAGVGAAVGAIAGGGRGAAVGAGAGAGAGTGAVLLTHGDPAVIPAESVVTFTLRDGVRVP